MVIPTLIPAESVMQLLDHVVDPEIPVLSITELGIVRNIEVNGTAVKVYITPTYSGCPAIDMISMNIRMELMSHGFTDVEIEQQLSPAWTTAWMTEPGKEKLKLYGIAPPVHQSHSCSTALFEQQSVQCPHCNSWSTVTLSEFGSTSCKALYKCEQCLEPFDYFKCH